MDVETEQRFRKGLGRNIRSARREADVRQRELAVALDVDQPQVSKWETGRAIPTLLQLADIAITCRRRPETLVEGIIAPTREQLGLSLDPATSALLYEVTTRIAKTGPTSAQRGVTETDKS